MRAPGAATQEGLEVDETGTDATTSGGETFHLEADFLHAPGLVALLDALEGVGAARVVGGAVRNALLGEPVADVDVATEAPPDVVAGAATRAGLAVHETGLEHGTLTIVAAGTPHEVTTLREDVSTDGRRATVRFTTDWAKDAQRRDFTMNALYLGRDGKGLDPVGGRSDCLARRVRFIGDPDARILEDHLRILRLFRFHAIYGEGALDVDGLAAARRHKARLATLAVERIRHELLRILPAHGATAVLSLIGEEGFLDFVLPGPFDARAVGTLAAAEASIGRTLTPALGLSALVGFDEDATARGADALKLSRRDRARALAALVAARAMPPRSAAQTNALLYEHGAEAFVDGLTIALAWGVILEDHERLVATARRWHRPRLPVTGGDLLRQGGAPGPELGARLAHLEALWKASDFSLDAPRLLAIDREAGHDR
ncbi:CCA tRNA nucleotidyltransferase [Acuticoccus sp.]|uniref:CCA tRNA nucleotidyltransferase n=1 Tax=Acuticoccus sp. TaxID=1904378 RepID=UPI003B5175D7